MRKEILTLTGLFLLAILFTHSNLQAQDNKTATDLDGNIYQTITLGDQVWFKENLKTTQFNDGTPIPFVPRNEDWKKLSTPAYCWHHNNEEQYKDRYGALYNWFAASSGKLCPQGWHVPTEEDWRKLEIAIGMPEEQANKAWWRGNKGGQLAGGQDLWVGGAIKSDPEFGKSGFNGLPSGNRIGENGWFGNIGSNAYWWSANERIDEDGNTDTAWGWNLYYGSTCIIKSNFEKRYGFCIRCVQDQE